MAIDPGAIDTSTMVDYAQNYIWTLIQDPEFLKGVAGYITASIVKGILL